MSFPWYLYLLVMVAGVCATASVTPIWRRWSIRIGLLDDPGHRKIHSEPIALAGGLAVFTGLSFAVLLGLIAILLEILPDAQTGALSYGFRRRAIELCGIFVGAVGMLLIGLADDRWELKPLHKFAAQFLVALLVAAAGVRLTIFIPNVFVSYGLTILWILTVINAFNFMDNMNGLCTGLGTIAAALFGVIAAWNGQYLVGLLSFAVAGSLAGFLPFNFPKAKAFLGDAGSHLIGFLMAVSAILPSFYTDHSGNRLAVLAPMLILAVPLVDMAYVVILRSRMGKPFYIGDTNHLSHRLVRRGFSKTKAVVIIWSIAAAIGLLSVLFYI